MRGWIPPVPLACGIGAFGLSWIALFAIARGGSLAPSFAVFGWVHLVALGWITLIALSILLHVIPAFLDVAWPWKPLAQGSILAFAFGVGVLLFGFFAASVTALQVGASIAFAALLVYAVAAVTPLRSALRGERVTRAIARALGGTLCLLLLTVALGVTLSYTLGGHLPARMLADTPSAHALLGIGGWLTLLVFGVSARTMQPISGARSRWPVLHIVAGICVLVGTIVAATGAFASDSIVVATGCLMLWLGTVAYAIDIGGVLRRATNMHKPPQVLMGCAAVWSVISAALLIGAAFGEPWAPCAVYAALIGWIGSAVVAHMHHIGVRVVLTTVRGEDDETRPNAVLSAPLTWSATFLYESAAVVGAIGAFLNAPWMVEVAAACGFLAFVAMMLNLTRSISKMRTLPISLA